MLLSIFDRRIRVSFTNFWNNLQYIHIHFFIKEIDIKKWRIVKYYNPQIHFFSVFGDAKKVKNSKARVKIFYTGENTDVTPYAQYKGNCVDCVDLSLGFNYIKTNNYIRLPIWIVSFFFNCDSKDEIKCILDNTKKQHQKTKFCALIASHDRAGLRTQIYSDVSRVAEVDCPGKLLHNDDTLQIKYNDNKRMYLQLYKFNICPENSIAKGYCTEKLFDSLLSGCIPIYNGYSKDPEPDIINPNIILWYDEFDSENNKHTLNEIKKVHNNDKLYRSFIEQPFFCDTAVDKIYDILNKFNEKIREILISKKII